MRISDWSSDVCSSDLLMTGQGGWPLNCFALPDQRPIYGGSYFRPEDWQRLLLNLDDFFREKRAEAEAYAHKLTAGIRQSELAPMPTNQPDRKSTRLNSSN